MPNGGVMALGIVISLFGFVLLASIPTGVGGFAGLFLLSSGVIVTIAGGLMRNTEQCHICGARIESKNLQMHVRDAHGKQTLGHASTQASKHATHIARRENG